MSYTATNLSAESILTHENMRLKKRITELESEVSALKESVRWIPVSERLPNIEHDDLLVWIDEDNTAHIGKAYNMLPYHEHWPIKCWMALPPTGVEI